MKRIATLLILSFAFVSAAFAKTKLSPTTLHQDESGAWTYEKIVDVPGTAKAALYGRMKAWVLTNIKTADKNTLTDDPSQEQIITTVTIALGNLWTLYTDVQLNFKLTLQFKDDKMKMTAGSFSYYAMGTSSSLGIKDSPLESYEDEKGIIKKINEKIDEQFPAFMAKAENGARKKSSDW